MPTDSFNSRDFDGLDHGIGHVPAFLERLNVLISQSNSNEAAAAALALLSPTSDQKDALDSANPPSGANPFATMADLGGGTGGGIMPFRDTGIVIPTHPGAVDDTDLATPFVTIQGAVDALEAKAIADNGGPPPYLTPVQMKAYSVLVAEGIYDEALILTPGLFWRLFALGQVTLGDGALANLASTVPRDVTVQVDQAAEPVGDQIRPTAWFGTLTPDPTSSTHTAYSGGWDITGDLILVDTGPTSTIEVHLHQVKVRGALDATGRVGGITNCYVYHSYFDTDVLGAGGTLNLIQVYDTEFDGIVDVATLGRVVDCEFDGPITVTGIGNFTPPNGFVNCDLSGLVFTGPAGSFIADQITAKRFFNAGGALAGGATWDPIGDYYAPAVPGNWVGAAPATMADALDRIAAHVGPVP